MRLPLTALCSWQLGFSRLFGLLRQSRVLGELRVEPDRGPRRPDTRRGVLTAVQQWWERNRQSQETLRKPI